MTSTTSTVSGQNENYAYDSVGNRTSSHLSSNYGYQQGSFNRLTSTQQASYSFDSNGNVTSKSDSNGKWYYFYDHENRLVNATKFGGLMPRAGQSVGYQYDALGRRVVRQDKKTGRTEFTHDGLDVIQDRFEKQDGTNSTTNYINGLGIDDKLKITSGTTSKYFLTDHLGSTVGLSDSNSTVTESASYDSFGNKTGSLSTRYQYTGREQDEATGLMYYRARFYDPQLGRFTSEDPIGFEGGDVNFYGYVINQPLKYVDPLGKEITIFYDREQGRLVVIDINIGTPDSNPKSKKTIGDMVRISSSEFSGIFSGKGECMNKRTCDTDQNDGPIPLGVYLIDSKKDIGGNTSWKANAYPLFISLNSKDPMKGPFALKSNYIDITDPYTGKIGSRGGFYLHAGIESWGCVTFPSSIGPNDPNYPKSAEFDRLDKIIQTTLPLRYNDQSFAGALIAF